MLHQSTATLAAILLLQSLTQIQGFTVQDRSDSHFDISTRSEHCYGELGCFKTQDFQHPVHRPISLAPKSRDSINTRFGLYTRENKPTEKPKPQFLRANDVDSVKNSYFMADKPIKFLVHGFLDTGFIKWINELGNALLKVEDVNIIAVDWSGGNGFPYTQASANTWVVGGEIWLLSKLLIDKFGAKVENIHIIGHSLGSHIAGYAGQRFGGEIGRISGIDPAEPWFQYMPEHVRLDPTDAKFVDSVHTDAKTILLLGFGMIQPVGHLDFYPNKGMEQPGCDLDGNIVSVIEEGFEEGVRKFAACNHLRAVEIYTESITSSCPFVAHECFDHDYFVKGRCRDCGKDGSKCAKMGYYANQHPNPTGVINRKLYLNTESKNPLCVYHYSVTIVIENSSSQKDEKGFFTVTLKGSKASHTFKLNEDAMDIKKGRRYDFVTIYSNDLGTVSKVDFKWDSKSSILDPGSWFHKGELFVKNVVVESMDIVQFEEHQTATSVLCSTSTGALKPSKTYSFETSSNCKDDW